MFNSRGGGASGGGGKAKGADTADLVQAPAVEVPSSGGSAAKVLDLIQPHSVSAEEVAGFYGCAMDQAREG